MKYYIISVKHTSKGDTAIPFWSVNLEGYAYDKKNAGLYDQEEAIKWSDGKENVMVEQEKVDKLWRSAFFVNRWYTAIPNLPEVRKQLGISFKNMRPIHEATCKMKFKTAEVAKKQTEQSTEKAEAKRLCNVFYLDEVRQWLKLYDNEQISFSKFVELLNDHATGSKAEERFGFWEKKVKEKNDEIEQLQELLKPGVKLIAEERKKGYKNLIQDNFPSDFNYINEGVQYAYETNSPQTLELVSKIGALCAAEIDRILEAENESKKEIAD